MGVGVHALLRPLPTVACCYLLLLVLLAAAAGGATALRLPQHSPSRPRTSASPPPRVPGVLGGGKGTSAAKSPGGVIMQMGGDPATDCSLDLSKYDNFLFDCDGVLWAGAHALPGSIETVRALQLQGKVTKFITNNSTSSRRTYASKFAGLGLEVSMDDIVTSGSALAEYISTRDPPVKAAYVIGEDGFVEELELRGVRCVRTGKSRGGAMSEEEFARLRADEDVTCVAVGWDREFSFRQIAIASHYLQQPSCRLFAGCNPDASDRVGPFLMPGTGALLAAVERASGVSPVVVGKPNSLLIKQILVRGGMEPQRTIMFGDRIDTDIAFGIAGGIDTALVLSGVCSEEDARSSMLRPTYILPRLGVMQEVAMSGSAISE